MLGVVAWIRCPVSGGIHKVLADETGSPVSGPKPTRCGSLVFVHTGLNYDQRTYPGGEDRELPGIGFVWPRGQEDVDPLDARVISLEFTHLTDDRVISRKYAGLRNWTDCGALTVWERLLSAVWPLFWDAGPGVDRPAGGR